VTRVERFEDVVAWQLARVLTRDIYVLTRSHDFGRDWSLASQMQRAAVSVMANIAEGFDREGSVEFHRFAAAADHVGRKLGALRASLKRATRA